MITQRLGILVWRHAHVIDDGGITGVIEFAVRLEGGFFKNRLFDLFVADAEAKFFRILIKQRLIDHARQHLLAHGFDVVFIGSQFRVLIAKLLLLTITLAGDRIFKLAAANLFAVHFCGVITVTANQVAAHAGQYERHDNDTENNLEYDAVRGRT